MIDLQDHIINVSGSQAAPNTNILQSVPGLGRTQTTTHHPQPASVACQVEKQLIGFLTGKHIRGEDRSGFSFGGGILRSHIHGGEV
jgi:hypothetical protein